MSFRSRAINDRGVGSFRRVLLYGAPWAMLIHRFSRTHDGKINAFEILDKSASRVDYFEVRFLIFWQVSSRSYSYD